MNKECHKQFSVKTGTICEDSPIAFDKWLMAIWFVVNCNNGVSSYEIARDLKVTQKSAWFMLQRIRLALKNESWDKIGGSGSRRSLPFFLCLNSPLEFGLGHPQDIAHGSREPRELWCIGRLLHIVYPWITIRIS